MIHRSIVQSNVVVVAAIMLVASAGPVNAATGYDDNKPQFWNKSKNHCTSTSRQARAGCLYEIRDDYAIAQGVCINTADDDERNECYFEAWDDRWDANQECRDQYFAREDVCDLIGQDRYDPEYEPEDFEDPLEVGYGEGDVAPNPFFPLVPGTRWVYESEDEIITVDVLDETVEIDGVTCIVVRDLVVEKDGEDEDATPIEDTLDWYAQDKDGNIWYFGEIAVNYEDGQITDIDGSWKTGEEGARPGILMPAIPGVGDVYRQEWLLGDAEDMAEVISTVADPELSDDNAAVDCGAGCLQTLEWNPLESDSFEYKYYKPGVGMVQEVSLENPEDTVELVEFELPDE